MERGGKKLDTRLVNHGRVKHLSELDDIDLSTRDYRQVKRSVRLDIGLTIYPQQPKKSIERLIPLGQMQQNKLINFSSDLGGLGHYTGQMQDDVPHGFGKSWFSKNSGVYVGEWKGGLFDGRGLLRFNEGPLHGGSEYIGNFKEGLRSGVGKQTLANWKRYRGHWKNNMYDGYGTLHSMDGVHSGEFRRGKPEGWGKLSYPGGGYHEGMFVNGLKHGYGKHVTKEYTAEGEFVNGYSKAERRDTNKKIESTVKLEAVVSFEVTKDDLADALSDYDVHLVEELLQEVLDKAVAADNVNVTLLQGPTSVLDYGSVYVSEKLREFWKLSKSLNDDDEAH